MPSRPDGPFGLLVTGTLLGIGWHVPAKHWFTTIDLPDGVTPADEQSLEGT